VESAGLYLLEPGAPPEQIDTSAWRIGVPVWSPDGSRFAFVDGDNTVTVWERGMESWIDLPTDISTQLSWSPSGDALFAPGSSRVEPSYRLQIDEPFGAQEPLTIVFDAGNGPNGPPLWTPRQPVIPPASAAAGAGLDRP
jgi:hypothetical protein